MASSNEQRAIRIAMASGSMLRTAKRLLGVGAESDDTSNVFVALHADRIVAAASVQCRGRILATCTLPEVYAEIGSHGLADLLHHVIDDLDTRQVKLVTMLGSDIGSAQLCALESAGFTYAGDVTFYLCHRHRFPEFFVSPLALQCAAARKRELAEVMHRTCEQSLDLPMLLCSWTAQQMLDHLESLPGHRPELWFTATFEGQDVGTLLLEAGEDECRLVYLGIIPEYRGRGWGRCLLARAMQIAAQERVDHMVLSVDCNNTPAIRVYEQAGFMAYGTQSLYFQRLST
jgi:ribosomal protein S18 acetylase RimI-like enzyme